MASSAAARGLLVASAVTFMALATVTVALGALPGDAPVRDTLLAWATPGVLAVMRVVNYGGDKYVLAAGCLLMFVAFPAARARWWVWAGLMIATFTTEGLFKLLVARQRPESVAYGFPSGHAAASTAFFCAVAYLAGSLPSGRVRWVVRTVAVLAIVLVALARIILRAHWPSDALGGIALGLALASAAALFASPSAPADSARRA
jgi:undecaprenyl-diphosphatase